MDAAHDHRMLAALACLALGLGCNRPPEVVGGDEFGTGSEGADADGGPSGDASASGPETQGGDGDGDDGPQPSPVVEPCDGDPRAQSYGVEAVEPPSAYDLPAGALSVDSTGALFEALSASPTDIILSDGVYSESPSVVGGLNIRGHRLWSETPGGAVLQFGLWSGEAGAEVHGLTIDAQDPNFARTVATEAGYAASYALYADGEGLVVQDCRFDGGERLAGAIRVRRSDGVRIERVEIRDFTQSGVYLGDYAGAWSANYSASPTPRIEDLSIEGIGWWELTRPADVPFADQFAIAVNDHAELERIRIRRAVHTGVRLGVRAELVSLASLDVDQIPGMQAGSDWDGSVAVAFGRSARDVETRSFCIGSDTRIGFNGEWYQEPEPALHAVRPTIAQGWIASQRFGVHMDAGSVAATVEDVEIENYRRAGIVFFQNLASEDLLDTTPVDPEDPDPPNPAALWSEDASEAVGVSFQAGCPDAPELSYSHWNSHPLCG